MDALRMSTHLRVGVGSTQQGSQATLGLGCSAVFLKAIVRDYEVLE